MWTTEAGKKAGFSLKGPGAGYALLFLLLAPTVLYPVWMLVRLSLDTGTALLGRYAALLGGQLFWQTLALSLRISLVSCAIATALGVSIALALHYAPFRGWPVLARTIELMVAFPSFLLAFALIFLYGSQGSVTVAIAHLFGFQSSGADFLFGPPGVILAEVTYYIPFIIRPTLAVLQLLDPALEEAALSLGAKPLEVVRRVVLPLALPGIAAGAVLCFLLLQNEFGILVVLGSQNVRTLPMLIYNTAMLDLNLPVAAALAVLMLISSLVLYGLYRVLLKRTTRLAGDGNRSLPSGRARLRWVAPAFGWMAGAVTAGLFALPLIVVIASSLAKTWVGTILPQGLTLHWLKGLDQASLVSIVTSVEVALLVALFACAAGTAAALLIRQRQGVVAGLLDFFLMVPNAVPSVVVGLGVLLAYHRAPLDISSSVAIVLLAQFTLTLPFSYRIMTAAAAKLPPVYEEAAAGLGAGPWQRWWRVQMPLLAPGIRAACAIAFAWSIGELGATMMVYPPGFTTAPITIIGAIDRGFYYTGSALAALLFLAAFVFLMLISAGERLLVWRRKAKQKGRQVWTKSGYPGSIGRG